MRLSPALAALGWLVAACTSLDSQTTQYVGAPHFAPTDPKTVEILRVPPQQEVDQLGEIVVDASIEPAPPIAEIEQRLREEAAKLGASAVVVVFDRVQPNGAYVTGGWYTRSVQVTEGRKIVGVAIRNR
jgi:hypothetical protein